MGLERQISISTSFDYEIPIEAQIPLIAEAGFTHVSLGGKEPHLEYVTEPKRSYLKGLLRENQLCMDTIHGPRADQVDSIEHLSQIVEAAYDLSVSVIVIHGGPFGFPEEELPVRLEVLLNTCSELIPLCEKTGVKFALENVLPGPATDLIRQAVSSLDPKYFGFCYDSSHDQIGGPKPFDLLHELRDRVIAVHLSDRIRDFVDHVIPGEGFIDWKALSAELQNSIYSGPLLLEVLVTHSQEKDARRLLRLAYERGCQIYDQVFG